MAHFIVEIKISHVIQPITPKMEVVQETMIVLPQCPLTSWSVLMILLGAMSDVEDLSQRDMS